MRTPGLLPEMGKEIGGGLGTGAELLGSKHGLQLFPGIEPCGNFFIGRGMVGKSSFSFQYYHVGARIGKTYRRIRGRQDIQETGDGKARLLIQLAAGAVLHAFTLLKHPGAQVIYGFIDAHTELPK